MKQDTQDEGLDLNATLPLQVSQAESQKKNEDYWAPSWGPDASIGSDQRADQTEGGQS
jgi:hypothetical protein